MKRKIIRVEGVYPDLANVFGPPVTANPVEEFIASLTRPDGQPLVSLWLDGDAEKFLCTQEENAYAESIAWRDRTKGYYFTPGYQGFFTEGPTLGGQPTITAAHNGQAGNLPRIPAAQIAADGNPVNNSQGTLLMRMAVATTAVSTGMALATGEEATSSGAGIGYFNPNGGLSTAITGTAVSTPSGTDYRDGEIRTYGISWATDRGVSVIVEGDVLASSSSTFGTPTWQNIVLFGRGATPVASQVLQGDVARIILLTDDISRPFYDAVRDDIYAYMES